LIPPPSQAPPPPPPFQPRTRSDNNKNDNKKSKPKNDDYYAHPTPFLNHEKFKVLLKFPTGWMKYRIVDALRNRTAPKGARVFPGPVRVVWREPDRREFYIVYHDKRLPRRRGARDHPFRMARYRPGGRRG